MSEYIHAQEPELVPIDRLKVYDGNAKKHTRAQLDAVENSIREFGFRGFVIAWHNEEVAYEFVMFPITKRVIGMVKALA